MTLSEARQVWEERYRERERIWSGRVNVRLGEIAAELTPGRALDLGCGEGGDAVWLAEHGWQVTAVDIAQTALDRASVAAAERGLEGRIDFQRHELPLSFPTGEYDLVSAQFLHSMVELDRPGLLQLAAGVVAPGGVLVIVDHGEAPPWASKEVHDHVFPSAEEVLAGLDLNDAVWERVRVDAVERDVVGPEGQSGVLVDNVMVLRRRRPTL